MHTFQRLTLFFDFPTLTLVKKSTMPVRTDWVPTPRLQRRLREVESGRDLVRYKTLEEFQAWSRSVYEAARKKQKV